LKDINSAFDDTINKIVDNVAFHIVYPCFNLPHNLEDGKVGYNSGLELKDPVTLTLDQEKGNL